jgi:hypothetical protein
MSLWFATYFANETPPPLATLLEQEPETQAFTRHCFDFTRQWQSLLARGEKINTSSELIASWDTLQKLTAAYLDFCAKFPKRTLMQTLQLSNVTYDLIQLWDAQIKQVKTSRLLSVEETNQLYTARIEQFREFGLKALACRAIAFDKADANDFRAFFLGETTGRGYFHSHNGKDGGFHNGGEFSVQHWIVPLSEGRRPPPNDDARLTIVHQNFLRACALRLEPHLLDLLPKKLKESLQIFQQRDTYQANRFQPGKATFISLREESATVTVNIPMNYHSMILTIQQNRESDAIVFNAYWKGTDHEEKFRLPLIQSFCAVSELLLQNYTVKGLDFQVTLLANNATQADLISRMIHSVNESRWSCSDNVFGQLVTAMHEPSTNRELTREEFYIELEQTALRMKDILWKQFVATGTLPDDLLYIIRHIFTRQYLQERGLLPMIIERVTQELEGQKPPSVWSQNFSKLVLNTMPIDTQKKLV